MTSERMTPGPLNLADSPSPEGRCSDVLDYDSLIERCMGNLDFVGRVLTKLEQRLPQDLEELEQALAAHDPEHVARMAHRIKGSAANVSAEALRHVAEEIEVLGRSDRLADVHARVGQLRREWERCREQSRQLTPAISSS